MSIILVTGSAGLIGSESVRFFCDRGYTVVGIDNNMRKFFFGEDASIDWNRDQLLHDYGDKYIHHSVDIRDQEAITNILKTYNKDIDLIIHTAAQPSHDWAAREPYTDFTINANGTLVLLENTRQICPEATFIFCSTNKVYGDNPNYLPFVEQELRWEIEETHPYWRGIDETMSIDNCKHSLFGASKVAADILVQEYGRYFGMKTGVFRGGCLTGPSHSAAELHGYLAYLFKAAATGRRYTIYGFKGKQVRDQIHSEDVVNAIDAFYRNPRCGEVYNLGGGRGNSISILECLDRIEHIYYKKINYDYSDRNRLGDHICYYSDLNKLRDDYPNWSITHTLDDIFDEFAKCYFKSNARGVGLPGQEGSLLASSL